LRCTKTVAPVYHAVTSFLVFDQTFFEKVCVAPKPLRRFITPAASFSLKPFLKRLAFLIKLFLKKFVIKHFFEKVCVKSL
jgi:hypothetical protein